MPKRRKARPPRAKLRHITAYGELSTASNVQRRTSCRSPSRSCRWPQLTRPAPPPQSRPAPPRPSPREFVGLPAASAAQTAPVRSAPRSSEVRARLPPRGSSDPPGTGQELLRVASQSAHAAASSRRTPPAVATRCPCSGCTSPAAPSMTPRRRSPQPAPRRSPTTTVGSRGEPAPQGHSGLSAPVHAPDPARPPTASPSARGAVA